MPLNVTKLIGQVISGEPPYPQITLALTKLASIAIDLDISASIASSTHVQLVFAMPQNISRTVVRFAVVTTQLAPYLPRLRRPTVPLLPPDQSVRCLLHLQIASLPPLLDKPSMDPVVLVLPLPASMLHLSVLAMLVLPPPALTMTMFMILMPGIISMESRRFRRCLNAILGGNVTITSLSFLLMPLPRISLNRVFDSYQSQFFYSVSSRHLRS